MLGRYASNPELSFTWYDAAVLSQKIRQESRKKPRHRRFDCRCPATPTPTSRSSTALATN